MRITRAKPEWAGSGSVGEAKQASVMRSQQWWAEKLAVGIFYTTGSAELARTISNAMLPSSP